ncbi:MAG: type II-A CRISPR-associated protein Csn2 [Lachnospiraceae bacterium]|nr:type II-A CRISPR-associated protein Csn2 [Lachnospiraceae bacterium]
MKVVLPGINRCFECCEDKVQSLIIENPKLFCKIISDIEWQLEGNQGNCVVSKDDKVLETGKALELIAQFIPFDINRKTLINKAIAEMSKIAVNDYNYVKTMELMGGIEQYCNALAFEMPGNIEIAQINVDALLKAAGVKFSDDYERLSEKLLDYFELVKRYETDKVFVLLNIHSYMDSGEIEEFLKEVVAHRYNVLLIDGKEYELSEMEERYIVDSDLCEIS